MRGVRGPEYLTEYLEFLLDGYLAAAAAHERMSEMAGARERKRLIAGLRELSCRSDPWQTETA